MSELAQCGLQARLISFCQQTSVRLASTMQRLWVQAHVLGQYSKQQRKSFTAISIRQRKARLARLTLTLCDARNIEATSTLCATGTLLPSGFTRLGLPCHVAYCHPASPIACPRLADQDAKEGEDQSTHAFLQTNGDPD